MQSLLTQCDLIGHTEVYAENWAIIDLQKGLPIIWRHTII